MFFANLIQLVSLAAIGVTPPPTLPSPPILERPPVLAPVPSSMPTATPEPSATPHRVQPANTRGAADSSYVSVRLVASHGVDQGGNDEVLLTVFLRNHGPAAVAMLYAPPWTDVALTITDAKGKRAEAYDKTYQIPDRQGRPVMLLANEEMEIDYHGKSAFPLSNWNANLNPGNYTLEAVSKIGSPLPSGLVRSNAVHIIVK